MGPHFEKSITLTNGCSVSTPVKALYSYTWSKVRISLILTVGLRRVGEHAFARRSDIRQANIRFFGSYPSGCDSLSVKLVATTVIGIIARRGETVAPYPTEYREVVDRAKKEVEAGYRPEIEDLPIDIDDYDVIFVGSPCWWYTMAPAVATFLSSHDFKGKAIAPFMTHEGSRFARTLDDIRKICPDAVLLEGFTARGSKAHEAMPDVREWIERLGLKR